MPNVMIPHVTFQNKTDSMHSDHLSHRRQRHIKDILDILDAAVKALLTGVDSTNQYLCTEHYRMASRFGADPRSPYIQEVCRAYTAGILMQNLVKESLWPIPDAHSLDETTQAFHERLTSKLWNGYNTRACQDHDCNTKKSLDQLLKARGWDYNNRMHDSIRQDLLVKAESFGLPQYAECPVPSKHSAANGRP